MINVVFSISRKSPSNFNFLFCARLATRNENELLFIDKSFKVYKSGSGPQLWSNSLMFGRLRVLVPSPVQSRSIVSCRVLLGLTESFLASGKLDALIEHLFEQDISFNSFFSIPTALCFTENLLYLRTTVATLFVEILLSSSDFDEDGEGTSISKGSSFFFFWSLTSTQPAKAFTKTQF